MEEMKKWVIDGQEFDSFEEANERLLSKSKEADKRFRDAAETQKTLSSMQEELDRLRAEHQQLQASQAQADPQEDPVGFVRSVLHEELGNRDRALQALGGYVRQMQSDMRKLSLQASGVDSASVENYVREKYGDNQAEMGVILGSNRLMQEQQRLMDMDSSSKEINDLLKRKKGLKAALTTQSGDGVLSNGERVPTLSDIAAMSGAEYEKVLDRMSNDPEYMSKVAESK